MNYDPFRNYDAWKTASPYDECWDEDYPMFRCKECGAFLKYDPDRVESGESVYEVEDIDGGTVVEKYPWYETHRVCKKCGHDNVDRDI